MSFKPNFLHQQNSPLGAALQNLTTAFFSGPSGAERDMWDSRRRAYDSTVDLNTEKTTGLADKRRAYTDLGSLYQNMMAGPLTDEAPRPDAGFVGPMPVETRGDHIRQNAGGFVGTGLRAGMNPKELGQLMFQLMSTTPGMNRDDVLAAYPDVLSKSQREGEAFSALPARMQSIAVGPTDAQTRGTFAAEKFGNMGDLSAPERAYLGADGGKSTPRNWTNAATGRGGITLDGLTDAQTGEEIPGGSTVYTGQLQGTSKETGLRPGVQGKLQEDQIAAKGLRGLIAYTRDIAQKDPMNFGFPGFVKGAAQDAQALLGGVSAAMGYSTPGEAMVTAQQEAAKNGIDPSLISGVFDPNLPALQSAADLLVFQAASALAGQSGRSVSDRDVKFFKGIVGDPRSFMTSQDRFLAKLKTIEDILGIKEGVTDAALKGGPVPGRPAPAGDVSPILEEARDAIRRGANPAAVRQRLQENGIDPSLLEMN